MRVERRAPLSRRFHFHRDSLRSTLGIGQTVLAGWGCHMKLKALLLILLAALVLLLLLPASVA